MKAVFDVHHGAREKRARQSQTLADPVRRDAADIGEALRRTKERDAARVVHEHFLEHRAIEAVGVLAKIGERELRLEVKQRRQVAAAGLEIDEDAFALVAGNHRGDVRGERAGASAAAGRENRQQASGRLGDILFRGKSRQSGVEFRVEFFLIEKILCAVL